MKTGLMALCVSLLTMCCAAQKENTLTKKEQKDGWQLLFDGKTLNGWRGIYSDSLPKKGWAVENGELHVLASPGGEESTNGGDLISTKEFDNFEITWEWKMLTKGGNSGLKYLVQEAKVKPRNRASVIGLEYQILDDDNHPWMLNGTMKPGDYYTVGALYNLYEPSPQRKVMPLGEWNTSKVISKGKHVEQWLNGIKVVEYERGSEDFEHRKAKSKFKDLKDFGENDKGAIVLQDHGAHVAFRNLKLKLLK